MALRPRAALQLKLARRGLQFDHGEGVLKWATRLASVSNPCGLLGEFREVLVRRILYAKSNVRLVALGGVRDHAAHEPMNHPLASETRVRCS